VAIFKPQLGKIELWRGSVKVSEHTSETAAVDRAIAEWQAGGTGRLFTLKYPNKELDVGTIAKVVLGEPPANIVASPVTHNSVQLNWTANSRAVGYVVYRNGVAVQTVTGTTHTSSGLAVSTAYSFTVSTVVAALSSQLEGPQSSVVIATTQAAPDTTAPTAPVITATATGQTAISVALTTASTDAGGSGVSTYRLEYKRNADAAWTLDSATLNSGSFPRPISGLTAATVYDTRCRATDVAGNVGNYSATSQATTQTPSSGTITHGEQLTINDVGPWSLQAVAKGSESLDTVSLPSRGYWRGDTPNEWSPTGNYVYNNSPSNKGGVVPAGGMVIDGYTVPAGTRVAQFRNFSAGDFYVTSGQNILFRGCRWRHTNRAPGDFNCAAGQTSRIWILHCDSGGVGAADAQYNEVPIKLASAGSGSAVYRCYISYTTSGIQINASGVDVVENFIEKLTLFYGSPGPPGESGEKHLNGITVNGGENCMRVLRNRILVATPDEAGHAIIQTDCISFFQDFGTFPGTGTNPQDGTIGYRVMDNYIGGTGFCLYAGKNAGSASNSVNNMVVTGNKITNQWYPNGGSFGSIAAEPAWGTLGNVKSNNTIAETGATW
jgi:hypothetical protein